MTTCALDCSDSIIRLVTLKRSKGQLVMPVRAEIPVPAGVIVDGDIHQPALVTELLTELCTSADPKIRRAVISLPERHTFIACLTLPPGTSSPTLEAVKAEALQQVPYAWDEMYFDWTPLPKKNSHGQIQVAFGAAPKTIVDAYVAAAAGAKLEPENVVIESLAIARAMFRSDATGTHIILDLGRTRSTIILVQDGIVCFSATVRYAGKDLNRFIADQLRISDVQAEKAKSIFGLDPTRGNGVLRKVLLPQIDVLAEKIAEVEAWQVEHFVDRQPIASIILTGSGSLLRQIDTELADRVKQPVVRQPAWIYEDLRRIDPTIPEDVGVAYTTAFGLALETL